MRLVFIVLLYVYILIFSDKVVNAFRAYLSRSNYCKASCLLVIITVSSAQVADRWGTTHFFFTFNMYYRSRTLWHRSKTFQIFEEACIACQNVLESSATFQNFPDPAEAFFPAPFSKIQIFEKASIVKKFCTI